MKVNIKVTKVPCFLLMSLRQAMSLCRWTGYFPVQGLNQIYADGTKYKIKCFYSIYHFATIIGQVVMTSLSIVWFFNSPGSLSSASNIVFYGTGLISAILLTRLARQLPMLMKKAEETEQNLNILKLDKSALRKSSLVAGVIMSLALVEHVLCTYFNIKFIMECQHETSISQNVMEKYVIQRLPFIFNYISYSIFNAVLTEILCLQATFLWSFNDVLSICFSIYLTSYFQSLNKVISSKKNFHHRTISWGQLREHYSRLVMLVNDIDDQLSAFILLSFFTDLFYICLQLFNSLHRKLNGFKNCDDEDATRFLSSPDYLIYYLYSFLFLVLRALSLSLFAANVHVAAQEPIIYVYSIPSRNYDKEVHRFQSQLTFTKVAMSGKFFYVTRNVILQALGAILTYELVLLQFSRTPNQTTSSKMINNNATEPTLTV